MSVPLLCCLSVLLWAAAFWPALPAARAATTAAAPIDWVAQGRADAGAGLPILALADWARAATLDPARPDVYDARGAFYAGRNEWDAALSDTTKAVGLAPTPPRLRAQGDALLHLGKHAEAARAYSRALSLSVEGAKTAADYLGDAQSAEAAGSGERAASLYAQALRLEPTNADALRRHQALFLAWGDTDTALADASALIALSPQDAQGYQLRADVLRQRGDWKGAIADATQVVTLAPQDAAAWLARGVTYSQQAEGLTGTDARALRQRAVLDFTQALTLDPNSVQALAARGTTLYAQADYDRALPDLSKAIDLGAGFSVAFLLRANIEALRGQDALALPDFTRAAQLDPSDARAYTGRAAVLRRLGRAAEAAADDVKARQLTP